MWGGIFYSLRCIDSFNTFYSMVLTIDRFYIFNTGELSPMVPLVLRVMDAYTM